MRDRATQGCDPSSIRGLARRRSNSVNRRFCCFAAALENRKRSTPGWGQRPTNLTDFNGKGGKTRIRSIPENMRQGTVKLPERTRQRAKRRFIHYD